MKLEKNWLTFFKVGHQIFQKSPKFLKWVAFHGKNRLKFSCFPGHNNWSKIKSRYLIRVKQH